MARRLVTVGDDLVLHSSVTVPVAQVTGGQSAAGLDAAAAALVADAESDTAVALSSTYAALTNHRRGSGSPLSVVTPAAVGEVYADTAQTNGARLWVSTGTTSTSWKVLDGATGWRNMLSLLVNGWTATSFQMLRTPTLVHVEFFSLDGTGATAATLLSVPTGFSRGASTGARIPFANTTSTLSQIRLTGARDLQLSTGSTYATNDYAIVSWPTRDAWPTTLPGTAA